MQWQSTINMRISVYCDWFWRYDICAAPFGTSYFFSSWLIHVMRPLLDYLLVGVLLVLTMILVMFAAV